MNVQATHRYATELSRRALTMFDVDALAIERLLDRAAGKIAAGEVDAAEALLLDVSDFVFADPRPTITLGDVRLQKGDVTGAARAYSEALDRARKAGDRVLMQRALVGRAAARRGLGLIDHARADLDRATEMRHPTLPTITSPICVQGGVR